MVRNPQTCDTMKSPISAGKGHRIMGNVLGSARLSRATDESTSIERQTEQITYRTKERGDNLIHVTVDSDVSGSISPFAREGLGPWLTDPEKIAQWDTLIVAKLDRLTRSVRHFDEITEWCERNGKTLIMLAESIDLSTSTGRMFAGILAQFAQFERERMGERRKEAGIKMRENGWWQGGQAPFGYVPVKVDSHWELRESPTQKGILERIARQLLDGTSRRAIGRNLDADGIPTPKNAKTWGERTITNILRKIIDDEDPILDEDTRKQVAEKLDDKATGWNKRGETPLFLGVAYCECGKPLYSRRWVNAKSGKLYEYYRCADKCPGSKDIPMARLDSIADDMFTNPASPLSAIPVYLATVSKGRSVKAEMKAVERKMDALDKRSPDYVSRITELAAELNRLETVSTMPDGYSEAYIGTLADLWQGQQETRREMIVMAGIKFSVGADLKSEFKMEVPERLVVSRSAG